MVVTIDICLNNNPWLLRLFLQNVLLRNKVIFSVQLLPQRRSAVVAAVAKR